MQEPPRQSHGNAVPAPVTGVPIPGSRTRSLPRRLALAAIGVACTLAVLHAVFTLSYTMRGLVSDQVLACFDMRYDYSLPSWFGFLCMLAAGVACFGWGRAVGSVSIALTGVFFVLLTIDDLLTLHERTGGIFWSTLQGTGMHPWVAVLGLPFAAIGVAACRACWRNLTGDRAASLRLVAGFACLGVALALEALEQRTTGCGITWRGFGLVAYSQWVEEFLELLGPLLVAWTAAEAWQRGASRLRAATAPVAASARS